eukprot:TRINITY_DN568_c0_g1_i4.p1 TRINITY_DN568_c0_g1~~TRINITY_DN568_c0_g1_i4.p1  ORF type:complete len:332 (-),score=43.65 TRINITY_DN568_c0_g1_i4:489-1484(-)
MSFHSVFDLGAIRSEFQAAGISPQFIPSIWKYVLQNPKSEAHGTPSLPSSAYPILISKFRSMTSTLESAVESKDGITTKLLVKLQNGSFVEAVIMKYDPSLGTYDGKPRTGSQRSTVCISSQGMGEPLNNYSAVVEAIQIMTKVPFQLSPKKITVSTVGIIHNINKLHDDLPNVNLAISLHAPVQDIRCRIMPAARAFPLERLIDALQVYQTKSQQKIFIEYIMLDGVNDEEQHAHQLGKLLGTLQVVVNLIPFNPIGSLSTFTTSSEQSIIRFQKILRSIYNIRTTVRQQMGQDISGACGQLVVNLSEQRSFGGATLLTDIEDFQFRPNR